MHTLLAQPDGGPSANISQNLYHWRASFYDWQLAPYDYIRQLAVDRLQLQPGQTVLDIGCGTGMSLPLLEQAVGPKGKIVAVDQCPDMLDLARQRVQRHGWRNVELICAPIEQAELPLADAALLHLTHDILQQPAALDRVLACLPPGAALSCSGLKWTSPWLGGLNTLVCLNMLQSITQLQGLHAPWAPLLERGWQLDISTTQMGTVFVASGRAPATAAAVTR